MYVFGTEAFETIINARGRDLVRNGIGSPKSCLVVLLFVAQSLVDLRLQPACSGSDEIIPILTWIVQINEPFCSKSMSPRLVLNGIRKLKQSSLRNAHYTYVVVHRPQMRSRLNQRMVFEKGLDQARNRLITQPMDEQRRRSKTKIRNSILLSQKSGNRRIRSHIEEILEESLEPPIESLPWVQMWCPQSSDSTERDTLRGREVSH